MAILSALFVERPKKLICGIEMYFLMIFNVSPQKNLLVDTSYDGISQVEKNLP